MFLKQSSDGLAYLEQLFNSAVELKTLIEKLQSTLNLPNADLETICVHVQALKEELDSKSEKLAAIEDENSYSQATYNKLLAELAVKELSANIANFSIFELIGTLNQLINSKKDYISRDDYLEHVHITLSKIVNLDVLKKKDILYEKNSRIAELEKKLEQILLSLSELKMKVAALFTSECVPDIGKFEDNFAKFQETLTADKLAASKYRYLLSTGMVKEVNGTISSNQQFHVNYNGK